ncbi:MAG: hypothetical protein ABMB14_01135 [Myxococcota bacterium]
MTGSIVLLGIVVAVFAHQLVALQASWSEARIAGWAVDHRVEIVAIERRWVETGPFSPITAGDQPVFHLRVRAGGAERTGWLQVGRFPLGVFDPHVEVRWS